MDDYSRHIVELETRVSGIERAIVAVSGDIKEFKNSVATDVAAIKEAIGDGRQTNWPVLLSAFGLLFSIVGFAWYSIKADQAVISTTMKENRGEIIELLKSNRAETHATFAKLSESVVSRQEHEGRWHLIDKDVTTLQKQIDDIRTTTGASYNLRDVLRDTLARLDRIEQTRAWRPIAESR